VGGGGNFLVTPVAPRVHGRIRFGIDEKALIPSLFFHRGRVYYARNGTGVDFEFIQSLRQAETRSKDRPIEGIHAGDLAAPAGVWPEGSHLYAFHVRILSAGGEGGNLLRPL